MVCLPKRLKLALAGCGITILLAQSAVAQGLSGGISGAAQSISNTAQAMIELEIRRQEQEDQYKQQMDLLQRQHDMRMLELQKQQEVVVLPQPAKPSALDTKNQQLAIELNNLNNVYPNWRIIVGAPDKDEKPKSKVPFRKWLARQPESYQAMVNNTESPAQVELAITDFFGATATAKQRH